MVFNRVVGQGCISPPEGTWDQTGSDIIPPLERMTDTCKSITFPQLRLWVVEMLKYMIMDCYHLSTKLQEVMFLHLFLRPQGRGLCHFLSGLSGPMSFPGEGYDVTSYLVPCPFWGICLQRRGGDLPPGRGSGIGLLS